MDFIIDAIVEWLKGLLVDGIMGNLDGLFDNVNQSVGEIATQVGTTPADWNAGVFSMIRQILNVTLTNKTLPAVILPRLDEQQREIYTVMQQLKGNKPYLWEGIYTGGEDTGPSYEIPGEALDDPAFAALMAEATKYIGWPYVWGGSSPSTSFDCSGFVCWVYTASGVHNLPRTTAQGIYNQCAIISPSEAKPGDIIFFTGTYDSPGPVSHVGIYVGDGMMLHCGSPIQYANINSSYWQTHFYAFGRL